uniref:Putative plant transposon protein domain-containing protein n=1 Tax=Nicotiana tabacum TaxID=4097 RepID=A0A1S4CYU4_TOBAC|nr:PREDICTED: uncharacterized protein LOC107824100 [Nicotiana tabacum]XP_016506312.1 PREDICTED: uncharacterized protein LOC107824100 [Nicotiana tabacum]XP_016506313.1 PREDICTED: uncharacterized protein LOC107824100 [Nicotiana tabacum]
MELGEEVRPWLAQYLEIPGTTPDWLNAGVKILRRSLNFEAKGWETFVCADWTPLPHENSLPLHRTVLVASIMVGYPINVGNVMSRVITQVVSEGDRNYPFPSFLTMYFTDLKVEKRNFDIKVKAKAPFSWYIMQVDDNPKSKNYKGTTTAATGQSEEPVVVVAPTQPSSTPADMPLGPSTSVVPDIPSTLASLVTTHHLSQALLSINNWMQTVPLSCLSLLLPW